MAKFLDLDGLQSYDSKIKEYIDANGVPFKKIGQMQDEGISLTTIDFNDLEIGKLYWARGNFYTENGVESPLGAQSGWICRENEDMVVGASVTYNGYQRKTFRAYRNEDNTTWQIPNQGWAYSLSSENYSRISAAQENTIEKVSVLNADSASASELTIDANKGVTVDLSDYLKGVKVGATALTASNGVVTLSKEALTTLLGAATNAANGYMSSTDKSNLDTLVNLLGESGGDGNQIVDTIREVLAIFANYGEGTTVATALSNKVDKVTGKGLSSNDYTDAEQLKLSGIAAGAEVNVQSDWNATSGDAQILNKPTSLKNPNSLTINGTAYDGSTAKTVTIDKSAVGLGNVTNVNTANASNISSGTLPDARLSSAVATVAITTEEITALFV